MIDGRETFRGTLAKFGVLKLERALFNKSLYDIDVAGNDGQSVALSTYYDNVALVVNTASKCGCTPQYADLQILYSKYKDRGFVVLGFPSNDFLRQERGSDEEIAQFCSLKYRVTFPIFAKAPVKGSGQQPVYQFLTKSDPNFAGVPEWNFTKFLVDREGHVVDRFPFWENPGSKKVESSIEKELKKPRIAAR